jgi:uncharacterized protein YdhG (YjbR/CyaY superfamily)
MIPQAVQDYIDSIAPEHRALFDRMHRLILQANPGVEITLSYKMPTYTAGRRRLYVGAWQHGISVYGWQRDNGFASRHPTMVTSKGTLRLGLDDAASIPDEEFLTLVRAALVP